MPCRATKGGRKPCLTARNRRAHTYRKISTSHSEHREHKREQMLCRRRGRWGGGGAVHRCCGSCRDDRAHRRHAYRRLRKPTHLRHRSRNVSKHLPAVRKPFCSSALEPADAGAKRACLLASKVVTLGTQVLNGTRPAGSYPYATDSGCRRRIPLSGAMSAEAAGAWSVLTVSRRVAIAATDRGITVANSNLRMKGLAALGLLLLFGAIMLLAPGSPRLRTTTLR